ncbi:hypothetical protein GF319_15175 [Candidatus Bathyarchaeota archaeon]|nr:hypothetical protein [Candidatus Bathyarchaeota archaeon]
MKYKKIMLLISVIALVWLLSETGAAYGKSFTIKERNPGSGKRVESMVVPLTVTIYSGEEPVRNAYVWFYIDGEPVDHDLTDKNGFAGTGISGLDEFGSYKWKVRVEKTGYERIYSSEWSFNYQPRPVLTLHSNYGETYGGGDYDYNETATFGIEPTVIYLEEGKRVIFDGWDGVHKQAYTGPSVEASVNMTDDISEYAIWRTQYFLNMSCEVPPAVSPESGWFYENDIVGIYVDPLPGTEFLYWEGSGNKSYSGTAMTQSIRINGPIRQRAVFNREEFTLTINSDYGNTHGSGTYPAWENISFGVDSEDVYINEDERMHFTGWDTDSSYGYEGNKTECHIYIAEDTMQEASWVKQYYVNVTSTEGGNVSTPSGWMDENTEITLNTTGEQDYRFVGWSGQGEAHYSGMDDVHTIEVTSPIIQEANWKRVYTVTVESELPVEGEGNYLDGETATLRAQPSKGLLVRTVFKEWSGGISSTSNPLTITVTRDMEITAEYTKDYMFLLAAIIVIFVLVGIALFKIFA